MSTTDSAPHLRVYEWLALVSCVSLLVLITLVTCMSGTSRFPATEEPPHYIVDQRIEVFVEGAVEKPVRLIVTKGMLVEEVLQQVQLLPEADLSKLKLKSKVRRGQHIRVPVVKKRRKSGSTAKSREVTSTEATGHTLR